MKAQEFEDLIPDYILGKLTEDQDVAFSQYLDNHPEALNEWSTIQKYLDTPELAPSKKMDDTFYAFLEAEVDNLTDNKVKQLTSRPSNNYSRFVMPLLAASLVLLFGFLIGKQSNTNPTNSTEIVLSLIHI